MKKIFVHLAVFLLLASPVISFAQNTGLSPSQIRSIQNATNPSTGSGCFAAFQSGGRLGDLFNYATCLIQNTVIPLIFALALALFVWGVVQYVINGDDEAKKDKGRQFMLWGIIGLTVMVGVWGLVKILANTFGISTAGGFLPSVRPN